MNHAKKYAASMTSFQPAVCLLLLTLGLSACVTPPNIVSEKATDELTFEEQVALYSEEELGIREDGDGAIAVGIPSCEVTQAERDSFDALIPISDPKKAASLNRHAVFGLPTAGFDDSNEVLLHHNEYILTYNKDLKLPTYAMYQLQASDVVKGDRKDCFREDHRLSSVDRSTLSDYNEPVFDQGHLVPVEDMHRSFPTSVNTFYMSNMMPQAERFNRGVWKFLEGATRLWAKKRGTIYVISGPIFDRDQNGERDLEADAKRILPQQNVAQATHFFKIILQERSDGFIESMSFVLPHTFVSTAPNPDYSETKFSTIDEIERLTGYDFFSELPDAKEAALEAFRANELWERRS
jgi:endonuclease G